MAIATHLPVTLKSLPAIVGPFIRAKVNLQRDPKSLYGAYLPRLSAIDILTRGQEWLDADVRGVNADGIVVFFYSGTELIPWEKVVGVRIVSMDAEGRRTAVTERAVARQPKQVAA